MPVSFAWAAGGTRLLLTFDFPLVNVPLTAANWRVITATEPLGHVPDSADFTAPTIVRLIFPTVVQTGAESVTYAASPADLVGEPPPPHDVPVPAFEFPIGP